MQKKRTGIKPIPSGPPYDRRSHIIIIDEFCQSPPAGERERKWGASRIAIELRKSLEFSPNDERAPDWTSVASAMDQISKGVAIDKAMQRVAEVLKRLRDRQDQDDQFAEKMWDTQAQLRRYAEETEALKSAPASVQCDNLRLALIVPADATTGHLQAAHHRIHTLISALTPVAEAAGIGDGWELILRWNEDRSTLSDQEKIRMLAVITRLAVLARKGSKVTDPATADEFTTRISPTRFYSHVGLSTETMKSLVVEAKVPPPRPGGGKTPHFSFDQMVRVLQQGLKRPSAGTRTACQKALDNLKILTE